MGMVVCVWVCVCVCAPALLLPTLRRVVPCCGTPSATRPVLRSPAGAPSCRPALQRPSRLRGAKPLAGTSPPLSPPPSTHLPHPGNPGTVITWQGDGGRFLGGPLLNASVWSAPASGGPYTYNVSSLAPWGFGSLAAGGLGQCVNHAAELFFNGTPQVLARYPNIDPVSGFAQFLYIEKVTGPLSYTVNSTRPLQVRRVGVSVCAGGGWGRGGEQRAEAGCAAAPAVGRETRLRCGRCWRAFHTMRRARPLPSCTFTASRSLVTHSVRLQRARLPQLSTPPPRWPSPDGRRQLVSYSSPTRAHLARSPSPSPPNTRRG
jgi:hypothetical protein